MTGFTASDRALSNAIWRVIWNPRKIYSKSQIQQSLKADGIFRTQNVLFSTSVRRLLEDKADKKGLAVVIEQGCCFVTSEEYQILHKKAALLRSYITRGESLGHVGTGVEQLLASADGVSQRIGRLSALAGLQSNLMRTELEDAEKALAVTFKAGRAAANAAFSAARARTM